jgi:predicted nucleotide-binding protein (sugar kinase/HSP70/actin superfamily)
MKQEIKRDEQGRILFTPQMRKTHTILLPMMLPLHFTLLKEVFRQEGYRAELLTNTGPKVVEEGLKYVHNDTCYPALLVVGQFIDALNSGKYDLENVAVAITQTGGGCRASNYIHLLRKALEKAGYGNVPVVSLNLAGLERNNGLVITVSLLRKALSAVVYGDMLMLLSNRVKAYEVHAGDAEVLTEQWIRELSSQMQRRKGLNTIALRRNLKRIVEDFAAIPVAFSPKIRVGIVGEIYVKYSELANNELEAFLHSQDCEVHVPGLMSFLLYCIYNVIEDHRRYGNSKIAARAAKAGLRYLIGRENLIREALKGYNFFIAPGGFLYLQALTKGIISTGAKMGEGWLLSAEMMELIEHGYENIVCAQPFGCLPNHICGKGVINRIRQQCPQANIVAVDYDPSATRVNQENRIKLMLAVAQENQSRLQPKEPAGGQTEPAPQSAQALDLKEKKKASELSA